MSGIKPVMQAIERKGYNLGVKPALTVVEQIAERTTSIEGAVRSFNVITNPSNLYYKAQDGTEISADLPNAYEILAQRNREYFERMYPKKLSSESLQNLHKNL